ncbi:hypothetical protein BDF21DRAFT_403541 [Thamnidium elegans]|nr:hypothetical protein BDF21DRAFT_403541 [Thamnidium elegans]
MGNVAGIVVPLVEEFHPSEKSLLYLLLSHTHILKILIHQRQKMVQVGPDIKKGEIYVHQVFAKKVWYTVRTVILKCFGSPVWSAMLAVINPPGELPPAIHPDKVWFYRSTATITVVNYFIFMISYKQ